MLYILLKKRVNPNPARKSQKPSRNRPEPETMKFNPTRSEKYKSTRPQPEPQRKIIRPTPPDGVF